MALHSENVRFWYFDAALLAGVRLTPAWTAVELENWSFHVDLMRGRVEPPRDLHFKQDSGKRWCDAIWSGWQSPTVVSERFVSTMQSLGATGWKAYPVRVLDRKGAEVPGYFGLAVTGRAGPPDWSRSSRSRRKPTRLNPERGPLEYTGLWFTEATWDGSDIFFLDDTNYMVVTDRLVRGLRAAKLVGLELVPQSEFHVLATGMNKRKR